MMHLPRQDTNSWLVGSVATELPLCRKQYNGLTAIIANGLIRPSTEFAVNMNEKEERVRICVSTRERERESLKAEKVFVKGLAMDDN